MKFSANVSTLFKDLPFMDRFKPLFDYGFKYIEMQDPYSFSIENLKKEKRNMKVVLINSYRGDGYGVGAMPGEDILFFQHLSKSLEVAFHLECPNIHIFSGCNSERFSKDEQRAVFVQNLINAAEVLEEHNITGLIEPIAPNVINNYFLDSFWTAIDVIKEVDRSNIKLLLDIYHLQKIHGNAVRDIKDFYPYAGYIQISQDPGRTEPFLPNGTIDYGKIFNFLDENKYNGYIGLEYFPSTGNTIESLEWMKLYD